LRKLPTLIFRKGKETGPVGAFLYLRSRTGLFIWLIAITQEPRHEQDKQSELLDLQI